MCTTRCDVHITTPLFPSHSSLFPNVCSSALSHANTVLISSHVGGRGKATDEYRLFVKELYHRALAQILSPLLPAMTTPHTMRCPDGHYRRAIFELGPFIADYPEQVCLAGIVSGWCPKYVPIPIPS